MPNKQAAVIVRLNKLNEEVIRAFEENTKRPTARRVLLWNPTIKAMPAKCARHELRVCALPHTASPNDLKETIPAGGSMWRSGEGRIVHACPLYA